MRFLAALARTRLCYGRIPAIFNGRVRYRRNDVPELDANPSGHRPYLDCTKLQTINWCPLMALSRRDNCAAECPLLGVERTWRFALQMSAFDPKRTWRRGPG